MEKKPILFESACIFSIIGSSAGFIFMFISTLFFRIVTEKITSITNLTSTENLSPLYFAMLMSAFCLSLVGAIKLYRLQRIGLYFYVTAQALIMFLPVFWLGNQAFSTTNAIFTLVFLSVYLAYYKSLKVWGFMLYFKHFSIMSTTLVAMSCRTSCQPAGWISASLHWWDPETSSGWRSFHNMTPAHFRPSALFIRMINQPLYRGKRRIPLPWK